MRQAGQLALFVVAVVGAFVYICNAIPQIESEPVAIETAIGDSPEELVSAGKRIFTSDRAQCLTCHSLGNDPKARCPNQEGIGERAPSRRPGMSGAQYLVESVYDPNAHVVSGYPKNQMTPVNKPPIALSHDEILAVLAFLNTLGGQTDEAFVQQLGKAQAPWREGRLKPEEAAGRALLPVFGGDASRGREELQKQGCPRCHRLGDEGAELAPDLTAIGASQSPEYILESLLHPSAVIVKGYRQALVVWKRGGRLDLRGTIVEWIPTKQQPRVLRLSVLEGDEPEMHEIDLEEVACVGDTTVAVDASGGAIEILCGDVVEGDEASGLTLSLLEEGAWVERRIPPESIVNVNLPSSPMPSNLAQLLTPRQTYDLLKYLLTLKGAS